MDKQAEQRAKELADIGVVSRLSSKIVYIGLEGGERKILEMKSTQDADDYVQELIDCGWTDGNNTPPIGDD